MKKDKEQARADFMRMIEKSWTYDRLTEPERKRWEKTADYIRLTGNYDARWEQIQDVYHVFLMALDYKPIGWRETDTDAPLF